MEKNNVAAKTLGLKKREDYWDIVRGLLILGVFVGHDIGGWNFITNDYMVPPYGFLYNKWVITRCVINCVVPIFIFISGYMVNQKYFSRIAPFYINRTIRFLIPFAVWSGIYSLLEYYVYGNKVTLMSVLLGTNGIQLYYVLLMMQLVLLTPIFFKAKNKKAVLIASFVINVVYNGINEIYQYTNGVKFQNEKLIAACFVFFYTLGLYYRNVDSTILKKITLGRSIYLYIIGLEIYCISAYMLGNCTGNVLLSVGSVTFAAFINMLFSVILVIKVRERLKDHDLGKYAVLRALRWFGVHSMDFFLVHWVFENYIKVWFIDHVDPKYMFFSNTAIIAATVILCCIYAWIADRVRGFCKARFGKKQIAKS